MTSKMMLGRRNARLGTLAVQCGLITPRQLKEVLQEQARIIESDPSHTPSLGSLLVAKRLLNGEELNALLLKQQQLIARESDEPHADAPPASVADRYVVLNQITRRSHRVTYEALDRQLGRKVHMDVLLPETFSSVQDRLREEEKVERAIAMHTRVGSHPNIVSLYDSGLFEGQMFIATRWVGRESLETVLADPDTDAKRAVRMLAVAARAVHHLHTRGVIHRNLKPLNILVDEKDHVFLEDFSLVTPLEENLPDGGSTMPAGTPAYMSPEQALGGARLEARSDVYALGVILYQILAGRVPFEGSALEILHQHAHETPAPPLTSVRRWVTGRKLAPLEKLCRSALAKNPNERPQTAEAFAATLEDWLG